MSFLAPLYALGALAIGLPILLHLIRKQPQGERFFSSLMFLEASPPRLTKKNRIDQWLLLLLRAAAIMLLAGAFTRPYWSSPLATDRDETGIRRLILIDTSASMRRQDLMESAKREVEKLIQGFSAGDSISLYAFDSTVRPLVSVADALEATPESRDRNLQTAMRSLQASWLPTDLGLALMTAADLLQSESDEAKDSHAVSNEIIVVTDFQNGADLNRLEGYQWPANCFARIARVSPKQLGNASLSILDSDSESDSESDSSPNGLTSTGESSQANDSRRLRVRVANQADSSQEQFSLQWMTSDLKPIAIPSTPCRIAKGSSLVVRVPAPPEGAAVLQLNGDPVDWDNRWFYSTSKPPTYQCWIIGKQDEEAKANSGYFVEKMPFGTSEYQVQVQWRPSGSTQPLPSPGICPLIIVNHHASPTDFPSLRAFAEEGGSVLWVVDNPIHDEVEQAATIRAFEALTGHQLSELTEAKVVDYAMLEAIQFQHPLLVNMADSKFNDFTKIRFWHHRRLGLPEESGWQTLARFDDESPALSSLKLGNGTIWILTAGWQPSESQLALSSKFVPVLSRLFQLSAPHRALNEHLVAGDRLTLMPGQKLVGPDEREMVPNDAGDSVQEPSSPLVLNEPGFYRRLDAADPPADAVVAVNIDRSEIELTVADQDRLERLGVRLAAPEKSAPEKAAFQRQLRATELEARQSLWRWLIVGVLLAVALESLLCLRAGPKPATG